MTDDNESRELGRRDVLKTTGLAGTTGFAGCLDNTPLGGGSDDVLKLGGILPLTGGLANPATWIERAWNLWVDEVNEDGGLLDRDVELTIYDNELNQEKMRSLTQRLINQDDVDIFVGPYATLTMPVVAPILEQNGYTVLHQFWPRSHIKEREQNKDAFPNQFGFSAGNYTYPRAFINYLDSLDDPPTKLALAGRNDLYGDDSTKSFEEFTEQADTDFEIVADEYYDPEATSLSNIARSIQGTDPDVVCINGYMADSQLFMQGAADVDLRPTYGFWGNVGPQIPEWIPSLGSTGNYVFGSTPYSYSVPTDANERLANIAQEEYDSRPHYSYGFGYIQMQIYEQALRETGEVDQEALAEQFSSMTFDTVTGQLTFEDTNFADAPMFVTQVQGEDIPVLWPDDVADTEPIAPLPDEWPDG